MDKYNCWILSQCKAIKTWAPEYQTLENLAPLRLRDPDTRSCTQYNVIAPINRVGIIPPGLLATHFNHNYQWSFGTSSPLSVPMPESFGRQDIMMSGECTLYSVLDRHTTALCPLNCLMTLKPSLIVGLLGQQQISEWPSRPSKALLQPEVDNNLLCPMATIP